MQIINRKAKFNYKLLDKIEAGVSLYGWEAKAILSGRADLSNSFAKIVNGEAILLNANINNNLQPTANPTRTRKLLLHRNEIVSLGTIIASENLTLVPTRLYNKGRKIKVELHLAKGKRQFEKKESLKRQDINRDVERELKDL